jgi:hypothetical protein
MIRLQDRALAEQTVLTKEEQVKVDTNQSAWTYLILACKENAFTIMESVNDEEMRIKCGFASKKSLCRTRRLEVGPALPTGIGKQDSFSVGVERVRISYFAFTSGLQYLVKMRLK